MQMASVQFHLSLEHERAACGSIHPTTYLAPITPKLTLLVMQAFLHLPDKWHLSYGQVSGVSAPTLHLVVLLVIAAEMELYVESGDYIVNYSFI